MERSVSFLGLLVLMGIAYAFSKNRKAVSLRTIVWGVGLQLTFAVIILSQGTRSFVGMCVLALLIGVYMLHEDLGEKLPNLLAQGALVAVLGGATTFLCFQLAGAGLNLYLVGLALAVSLLLAKYGGDSKAGLAHGFGVLFLASGLAELWARGLDGGAVFRILSDGVSAFLALSYQGAEFLFGNLAKPEYFFPGEATWPGFGFQFAFTVLPTILFFSAFMAVMYYLGVVQVLISAMAKFMHWTMRTSGSETMSCTANVFIGQTEAPFLIKPFLKEMTDSELHAIMVGGFATIAGSVLAGYIAMGVDPGHLLAASVMSAPAALVMAKLLYPETEQSVTAGDVEIPDVETADNVVGAAANGTTEGLTLALNVGAMLIAFISLIACVDMFLGAFDGVIDGRLLGGALNEATGEYAGFFPGSLKTFFGTILAPLAFVMGVPWADAALVGNLLGIKLAVNEFVSYGLLGEYIAAGELSPRAAVIATYALCGFANFSSIGIQIGGIGAIAPEVRPRLMKIGVRAMFGGALASFMTATIAGILVQV